jgi:hypothetical protein
MSLGRRETLVMSPFIVSPLFSTKLVIIRLPDEVYSAYLPLRRYVGVMEPKVNLEVSLRGVAPSYGPC